MQIFILFLTFIVVLPQKAVRVTTIMKRLRAPEQSESRSTCPAVGSPADPAAPQAATDSTVPSSTALLEGTQAPATELSTGGEASRPVPEAEPSAEEPQRLNPDLQGAEPTSRCNGEAPAALHAAAEAMNEQG